MSATITTIVHSFMRPRMLREALVSVRPADQPGALKLHDDLLWDTIGADDHLTYFRTKPKIVDPQVLQSR